MADREDPRSQRRPVKRLRTAGEESWLNKAAMSKARAQREQLIQNSQLGQVGQNAPDAHREQQLYDMEPGKNLYAGQQGQSSYITQFEEGTYARQSGTEDLALDGGQGRPGGDRPRFWARRKKLAAVLSCIVIILLVLLFAPVPFGTLTVEGSKSITLQDVITAGQIREPVNILQIHTSKLQERLSHDLRIESVTVSYGLPAELKIRVVDRKAVAVAADQFGYIAIDKTGTVIGSGPTITDTSVPIISGVKLGNVLLGDRLTNKSIQQALSFLTALSPEGQKTIAEVNVGNGNAIVAYTVDGVPLRLGEAADMPAKAKMAEEMLNDIKKKHASPQYLDVNLKAPFIKE